MEIIAAHTEEHLPTIRSLFVEYARSLNFDLCFQNFEEEFAGLPGRYAPPEGRLLLGLIDGNPAGCVALRKLEDSVCEIKRLWVRPEFRSRGGGRRLAEIIIAQASDAGYRLMRLDTVASMVGAITLYRNLGFRETMPYTHNPLAGAIYMERNL